MYYAMIKSNFEKICMDGDIDAVNSVIRNIKFKNRRSINAGGSIKDYLNSGLKGACIGGHINIINLMIERGADNLDLGLYGACFSGHLDIINLMAERGADDWNLGLYGACFGGHLNIINMIIKKGCDLNWGLWGACRGGRLDIINFMIEQGADNWHWGLCGACEGGHLNIANLMIEKGADNWDGGLNYASRNGHLGVAKLMIQKGADNFDEALENACMEHHFNIIELLLEYDVCRWSYAFGFIFDMIDSKIVNFIIRQKIGLHSYLLYPKDKIKIFKLHEFGLHIDDFKKIDGFDNLLRDIEERQNTVKHVLDNHLVKDLIGVISEYIID